MDEVIISGFLSVFVPCIMITNSLLIVFARIDYMAAFTQNARERAQRKPGCPLPGLLTNQLKPSLGTWDT